LYLDLPPFGFGAQRNGDRQNAITVRCSYAACIDWLGQAKGTSKATSGALTMMDALAFLPKRRCPLAFDCQRIVFDFDPDVLWFHAREISSENVSVFSFTDVHGRSPSIMTVVHMWLLAKDFTNEIGEMLLRFCEFAHGIPMGTKHDVDLLIARQLH
jgi:hypothetical protein